MIRINNITRGRFGNRILQYNNLMQISSLLQTETSCSAWEGHEFFESLVTYKESDRPQSILKWDDILEWGDTVDIEVGDERVFYLNRTLLPNDVDFHIDDPAYCLHNIFYKLTKKDPRTFFTIKDKYKKEFQDDNMHVGIHMRGGGFITADEGKEIHEFEFYKDSIELVEGEFKNTHYHLCTDDLTFNSFIETVQFLKDKNLNFSLGSDSDYFGDFATLSECDILISSSSTFAVCAGFIGKEDKKIIHSQKWMQRNLDHTPWNNTECENTRKWQISFDNFWVDLYNGGSKFYKAWRFM